jgi:deoxyribodipyrimidine photo-lyase
MQTITIFNHRRDLRIEDNIALFKCLELENNTVIPVFFFDEHQIKSNNSNKHYFNPKTAYFIINSVISLKEEYKKIGSNLLVLYGKPHKCLEHIIKVVQNKFEKIVFGYNLDFSKYSIQRDNLLNEIANKYDCSNINDIEHSDYCLIPWKNMLNLNNSGYKQYGAYYKNALKTKVVEPINYKKHYDKFISIKLYNKLFKLIEFTDFDSIIDKHLIINNDNDLQWLNAGRQNCIKRLIGKNIKHLKEYNDQRNILSYQTSNISAYLNIGSISIREAYKYMYKIDKKSELIKQFVELTKERKKIDEFVNKYQTLDQKQESGNIIINKNMYSFYLLLALAIIIVIILYNFVGSSTTTSSGPIFQSGGGKLGNNAYYIIFGIIFIILFVQFYNKLKH